MKFSQVTLTIKGKSEKEIAEVAKCLQIFSEKITVNNIRVLANKASQKGINEKIQKFHNFI